MSAMDWWNLSRGVNVIMGVATIPVGALILGAAGDPGSAMPLALHALCIAAFVAGWFALNDLIDIDADRVNHPERPLPSGDISETAARNFGIVMMILSALALVGIVLHAERNLEDRTWLDSAVIWMGSLVLMVSYEFDGMPFTPSLKRRGIWGNLAIAGLIAIVIVFGAASVGHGTEPLPWLVAVCVMMLVTAREIAMDISDQAGDYDRVTLPMTVGAQSARRYAWVLTLGSIVAMLLPFGLELLPKWTLVFMLPSLLSLLAVKTSLANGDDAKAVKFLKQAMMLGILGFAICGMVASDML